jgi:hypothetical protein
MTIGIAHDIDEVLWLLNGWGIPLRRTAVAARLWEARCDSLSVRSSQLGSEAVFENLLTVP